MSTKSWETTNPTVEAISKRTGIQALLGIKLLYTAMYGSGVVEDNGSSSLRGALVMGSSYEKGDYFLILMMF